jgi:lipopolysaccharide assembly outer membrane protein LptD (OstA)
LYLKSIKNLFIIAFFSILILTTGKAQTNEVQPDTVLHHTDSIRIDSATVADAGDSLQSDSLKKQKTKKSFLNSPVKYNSTDSIVFNLEQKKVYIHKDGDVKYQKTELKADFIEFDMSSSKVYSKGVLDTAGKENGKPEFTDKDQKFNAKEFTYNFKTKKGFIKEVITKQDEGYLHGETIKKLANGHIDIKNGKYTTCDQAHPHFYLALTKAIVIPNDQIVSGPAYMVLEDVPLYPLFIPFGFFPNKQGSTSGILIPTYGESSTLGFYLRQGGYYFAINQHVDLTLQADIYTKGTWGLSGSTRYAVRYKFSGSFSGSYYHNVTGEKGLSDYAVTKDFSIKWSHTQDAKANPYSSFSASVDFSTSSYEKNHSYDATSILTNSKSSSISFQHTWPNKPFSFSGSLSANESNTTSGKPIDLTMPSLSFSMTQIYPFRKSNGQFNHWYDNIYITYTAALQNTLHTTDSLLFNEGKIVSKKNGFMQTLPISTKIKILKNFTLTPTISYKGMLYTNHIHKYLDLQKVANGDTGVIVTDTIPGLIYAQAIGAPSVSFSYSPKVYGMYTFAKNSNIRAIRHVISPTASISLAPDIRKFTANYYRTVTDENGTKQSYSMFANGIYGTPTTNGKSGSIALALKNTVEMKVKSDKDTVTGEKKVKLLESLDFSTSYNIFADSLKWSAISMSGGTHIFNNLINIRCSGTLDPYALDSINGSTFRVNTSEWKKERYIGRLTSASLSIGASFQSGKGKKADTKTGAGSNNATKPEQPKQEQSDDDDIYNYFNIPWSFTCSYSLSYSKSGFSKGTKTQSLSFSGDLSLTPKWKMSVSSGFDFKTHKLTLTTMNLSRNLHCWMMTFNCCPFGTYKYYEFNINVTSKVLQDLKYKKRQSWSGSYY